MSFLFTLCHLTLQGQFEIISLSGSFSLSEENGARSRAGGLSVSLAGSDGRVLGGGVAGMLTAASPVQVLLNGREYMSTVNYKLGIKIAFCPYRCSKQSVYFRAVS